MILFDFIIFSNNRKQEKKGNKREKCKIFYLLRSSYTTDHRKYNKAGALYMNICIRFDISVTASKFPFLKYLVFSVRLIYNQTVVFEISA